MFHESLSKRMHNYSSLLYSYRRWGERGVSRRVSFFFFCMAPSSLMQCKISWARSRALELPPPAGMYRSAYDAKFQKLNTLHRFVSKNISRWHGFKCTWIDRGTFARRILIEVDWRESFHMWLAFNVLAPHVRCMRGVGGDNHLLNLKLQSASFINFLLYFPSKFHRKCLGSSTRRKTDA